MPPQAFNAVNSVMGDTVKRCPPFIDAMTSGFLIPLICDVKVENGEFTWDNDLPPGGEVGFVRSPIGFHDASQVIGTPLFDADRFMIKFHNLWTIEAPEGYALLFTHPANRFDLPFTTLTGLVDCDRYHDNWIHFPAHWHDANFSGVLPKGTPVAQCMPVKRESWVARTAAFTKEETQRAHDLIERDLSRDRRLPAAVPGVKTQVFSPRRNFATALGRRKKRPCEAAASDVIAGPAICGAPRTAARRLASPASRSPISSRHAPRLFRVTASSGRNPSARRNRSAAAAYSPSSAITLASAGKTSCRSGAAASTCRNKVRALARSLRLRWTKPKLHPQIDDIGR